MTQQRSAILGSIQIRYRIAYFTFLRMTAWKRERSIGMSLACDTLLNQALDAEGVTTDPAVLLGLEEKNGE